MKTVTGRRIAIRVICTGWPRRWIGRYEASADAR